MAVALEVLGTAASPGRAFGPVYLADEAGPAPCEPGDDGDAHAALAEAIRAATADLERLAASADPQGAAMLEFQIEVLADPTIREATARNIDAGDGAACAWTKVLDHYIQEIAAAEDAQLNARTIDIEDIRNRVLDALRGAAPRAFLPGAIYVGKDLEPSRFLAHDWSAGGGIVLLAGSTVSHVALLARGRSVPMIVATGSFEVAGDAVVFVDGDTGRVSILCGGAVAPQDADGTTAGEG
jgi:phosphoenolpyruvate-protein phosphotransferase (PTS system enzyme I)